MQPARGCAWNERCWGGDAQGQPQRTEPATTANHTQSLARERVVRNTGRLASRVRSRGTVMTTTRPIGHDPRRRARVLVYCVLMMAAAPVRAQTDADDAVSADHTLRRHHIGIQGGFYNHSRAVFPRGNYQVEGNRPMAAIIYRWSLNPLVARWRCGRSRHRSDFTAYRGHTHGESACLRVLHRRQLIARRTFSQRR